MRDRPPGPADTGTDRRAVEESYTSVTPLRLDLTHEADLEAKLRVIKK